MERKMTFLTNEVLRGRKASNTLHNYHSARGEWVNGRVGI